METTAVGINQASMKCVLYTFADINGWLNRRFISKKIFVNYDTAKKYAVEHHLKMYVIQIVTIKINTN